MASINGAYGDITINNNITGASDLEGVLNQGNTMAVGQFIDATAVGGTAIDATGSDGIFQNISVEKIIPLGSPIITNVSLDGGITIKTGGNFAIDFEDGIQLKDNTNAFIYSDGTDLYLNPTGEILASGIDLTVGTLNYSSLNPPISSSVAPLSSVLTVGNDAGGLDITNLNNLSVSTINYTTLNPAISAGDPNITYQTTYANLGTDVLQTAINTLAGATRKQLIISNGSWTTTGGITFNNLDTVGIVGATSITPLTRITPSSGGFTLSGVSSTRNQFSYIAFNDTFTIDGTQGRHTWKQCDFLNGLTITGSTTNFLTFDSCNFTGGALTIPITFGAVVFFRACDFTGTTAFNLNNPMNSQVIFLGCIGLNPINVSKATFGAWNVVNGLTQVDGSIVNCNDLNSTANINGLNGSFTDGTTTINIDPSTTKGIEITNAIGQAKIKLVDNDGDEVEIQNTEIDVFHSSASSAQSNRYYQLKDANGNEVDWYIGGTTPTHVASKGSIFVETSTPSIYQSNGGGVWNTVGGGGGSSVVGSYNVPVIARATMSAGQTITSNTKVLFDTMSFVEPVGWISNISSNTFTIPFSGVYTIVSSINGTVGSNIPFAMTVVRNGSIINSRENEFTNAGDFGLSIFYIDYFSAGDLVQINAQAIGGSIVISNATSFFSIQGFRQDPLTISSTIYIPKIVKRIMSGTNVINTTPSQIFYLNPEIKLPNSTWINDSVNGEFTINENGVYQVNAGYQLPSPAGDYFSTIFIYKNGVEIQRDTEFINSSTTTPVVSIVGYYSLIVGDVIQIWAQNSLIGQAVQNQPASYFMVQKITV